MELAYYRAGRRIYLVYGVLLVTLLFGALMLYLASTTMSSMGTMPEDGGVLAPLWQRLMAAVVLLLLGIVPVVGMVIYAAHYVTAMDLDETSGTMTYRTAALFGRRVWEVPNYADDGDSAVHGTEVQSMTGSSHHDRGVTVYAPWSSERIPGKRWPLIVDLKGRHHWDDVVDKVVADALAKLERGEYEVDDEWDGDDEDDDDDDDDDDEDDDEDRDDEEPDDEDRAR